MAAEAAEAEKIGLVEDEEALDEAEQEMFRHLSHIEEYLDSHLQEGEGETLIGEGGNEIGKR